jgi:phosphoribosylformimino-5-aminoimidazole carboxamide ribotide isomerase
VASTDDLVALKAERVVAGAILGRALYDGRVDPAAALALAA